MSSILIKKALIVNEGKSFCDDLLIINDVIAAIGSTDDMAIPAGTQIIEASGKMLLPGVIDDHVHFRDPGLTYKADIYTETMAAAAGGITSFMDMPNTIPQTVTIEALNDKYSLGSEKSLINYSFYIGATNDNLSVILRADPSKVCGIKVFMGSSTGNMLLDQDQALSDLFANAPMPVAVHCEDEQEIRKNIQFYKSRYGEDVPVKMHPFIRTRDACFISSRRAVEMASKYGTRLHVLHLSTADEMKLFSNSLPLQEKKITAEVCVHHLWFEESSYDALGSLIKWNPAIKTKFDRDELRNAVNRNVIDVVATDHAPHTIEEKTKPYFQCPSGGPLVQHSLVVMLELWHRKVFSIEKVVEMMCHNPAILFNIKERGFIKEGYKADLCIVDPSYPWTVSKENILSKCGWSPFEGTTFNSKVLTTIVNGTVVYNKGIFNEGYRGERLTFDR